MVYLTLSLSLLIIRISYYNISLSLSPLFLLSPPDFSILYIHCFVYTVYDDFSGQQSGPGDSGQNAAQHHTNNTATKTDTGGFLLRHIQSFTQT